MVAVDSFLPMALLALIPEKRPEEEEVCHAGRDGDCTWEDCPQLKDYQEGCPLYPWHLDEEEEPWSLSP